MQVGTRMCQPTFNRVLASYFAIYVFLSHGNSLARCFTSQLSFAREVVFSVQSLTSFAVTKQVFTYLFIYYSNSRRIEF